MNQYHRLHESSIIPASLITDGPLQKEDHKKIYEPTLFSTTHKKQCTEAYLYNMRRAQSDINKNKFTDLAKYPQIGTSPPIKQTRATVPFTGNKNVSCCKEASHKKLVQWPDTIQIRALGYSKHTYHIHKSIFNHINQTLHTRTTQEIVYT